MKNITAFKFDNPIKGVLMPIVLSFMAMFWLILIGFAWAGTNVSSVSKYWVLFSIFLLNSVNNYLYQNLCVGANVLHKLRTPFHLWGSFITGAVRSAAIVWALVIVGIALLVTVAIPSWNILTVAAVISVVMCFNTMTALANHGRMSRIFLSVSWILSLAFIAAIINKINVDTISNDLSEIPALMRGALVLAWPAVMLILLRAWRTTPPTPNDVASAAITPTKEKITAYLERFSVLELPSRMKRSYYGGSQSDRVAQYVLNQMVFSVMFLSANSTNWNNSLNLGRALFVLTFTVVSFNCLVFKDLHWRRVLAPNHLERRMLGWHIFKYSAGMQLISFTIIALAMLIFNQSVFNLSWAQTSSIVWQHRFAPFELVTAVACAVAFSARAVRMSQQITIIVVVIGLIATFMFVTYGDIPKWPTWPNADGAYIASLMAVSAALIVYSNKLWTAKRLASALRTS